ncbi:hypothetical protein ABZS79_14650 [Streptomyces griseoloalbus]|uniref:hypothetical protein n=1 Tax=Streptomyces griseoloalbus TaxID=67303 RepID=UPI0033B1A670
MIVATPDLPQSGSGTEQAEREKGRIRRNPYLQHKRQRLHRLRHAFGGAALLGTEHAQPAVADGDAGAVAQLLLGGEAGAVAFLGLLVVPSLPRPGTSHLEWPEHSMPVSGPLHVVPCQERCDAETTDTSAAYNH